MSLTPQEKDALRRAGDLTAKVRQAEADGRVAAALAHRTGQYLMLKGSGAAGSDQARLDHPQKGVVAVQPLAARVAAEPAELRLLRPGP